MATWHDIESARDQWVDAPLDDERLEELLTVACQQVVAYAPKSVREALEADDAAPDEVPTNLRVAQLMQARNIFNAQRVDAASGGMGEDTFMVRPHPLDWMVKQIIRPRTGVPRVG